MVSSSTTGSGSACAGVPAVTTRSRFAPRDSTILTIQVAHLPGNMALPVNDFFLWEVPGKKVSTVSLVTYSTVITRNGFSRRTEGASTP